MGSDVDSDVIAEAVRIVGCRADAPDPMPGIGKTFAVHLRESIEAVAAVAHEPLEPLPTAPEVREWLEKLAGTLARPQAWAAVLGKAPAMWRYFVRPGAPKLAAVRRVWRFDEPIPYERNGWSGLYCGPQRGPVLNLSGTVAQWREDLAALHANVGDRGGRRVKQNSPRRMAASCALWLLDDFRHGPRQAEAHDQLAALILSAAVDDHGDVRKYCLAERRARPER